MLNGILFFFSFQTILIKKGNSRALVKTYSSKRTKMKKKVQLTSSKNSSYDRQKLALISPRKKIFRLQKK